MKALPIFTFLLLISFSLIGQSRLWNMNDGVEDKVSLLEEVADQEKVVVKRIFPVPAVDVLTVEFIGPSQALQYEIFSIDGKLVKKGILESGQIQVDRLARSNYVLRLFDANKRYAGSWKFIKA